MHVSLNTCMTVSNDCPVQVGETVIPQATEYVEEEAVDNDLTLVQQELNSATSADLSQQSILGQTGLQDPLGLSGSNLDQQILNQPVSAQIRKYEKWAKGSWHCSFLGQGR